MLVGVERVNKWVLDGTAAVIIPSSLVLHLLWRRLGRNIKRGTAVPLYNSPPGQVGAKIRERRGGPPALSQATLEFEASIKQLPWLTRYVRKMKAKNNSPDLLNWFMRWALLGSTWSALVLVEIRCSGQIKLLIAVTYGLMLAVVYIAYSERGPRKRQRGHRKRVGFE